MRARAAAALVVALLGGCRLVDQRTFERAASAPDAAALTHASLPPLPLLVVTPNAADSPWRAPLAQAVQDAQARNPDVAFEVVTPIPTSASQLIQDRYTANGQADAQLVARELQSDGVTPERITLRFQGDAGAPAREVRLYAR